MTIITEAVEKLRTLIEGSGCEDGIVTLLRNPDAPRCQFERGVTIEAHFGGGHGQVVTDSPIQATTRISSMYGSPLASSQERSAALAIINAAAGFLCIARKLRACPQECNGPCLSELRKIIGISRVACIGDPNLLPRELAGQLLHDLDQSEIILVEADGAIAPSLIERMDRWRGKKRIVFLGPTFPGLCSLLNLEHWCPYGR